MGYSLVALIGRAEYLGRHASVAPSAKLVSLPQGFGMIPLASALVDDLRTPVGGIVGSYPRGFYYLSPAISDWASQISFDGPVAYVEVDFFGGIGSQAMIAWEQGEVILGPIVTSTSPDIGGEHPEDVRDWAVNRALRALGVTAEATMDEFDTMGLGKRRDTEEWAEP